MSKFALVCMNEQFSAAVKTFDNIEDAKKQLVEDFTWEKNEQGEECVQSFNLENGCMAADLIISEGEFEYHWRVVEINKNFY